MGQCANSNCAHDSKLGGVTETPEGRAAIQRDFSKLEKWANMKFNKEKYEVLHLEKNNPLHQCMMGAIVSKGLMAFGFYALNKYCVVKSLAENIQKCLYTSYKWNKVSNLALPRQDQNWYFSSQPSIATPRVDPHKY